jgi:urease accessory protein
MILGMLLADGRFPAGTYAHSLGLEQAVSDGLDAAGVPAFIAARLRLVAEPEARLSVAARRAAQAGGAGAVAAVEDEWAARCPNPVLRESARRLGAGLLRSAAIALPSPLVDAYRAASSATPRTVALGVVAAAWGVDDAQLAGIALYDDAATVASAALKLLALDPAAASGWVAALDGWIAGAASAIAADARALAEQPGPAAVGLELAASVHAERRERLFVT